MASVLRRLFNFDYYSWLKNGKIKPEKEIPTIDFTQICDKKVDIVYDESYTPKNDEKSIKFVTKPTSFFSNIKINNQRFSPVTCKDLIDFIPPPEPVEAPPPTPDSAPATGAAKSKISLSKPALGNTKLQLGTKTKDPEKKVSILNMSDNKEAGATPILQKQPSQAQVGVPKLTLSKNATSPAASTTTTTPAAPTTTITPPKLTTTPSLTANKPSTEPLPVVPPKPNPAPAINPPVLPSTKPALGSIQKPNLTQNTLSKPAAPSNTAIPPPPQAVQPPATQAPPPPPAVSNTQANTTQSKPNAWGTPHSTNTWGAPKAQGFAAPSTSGSNAPSSGWGLANKNTGWGKQNAWGKK